MAHVEGPRQQKQRTPVFVVSGGVGASGELLVRTAIAQFPDADIPVTIWPHIVEADQVDPLLTAAKEEGAILVHTLVQADLREKLIRFSELHNITTIDLVGGFIESLASKLEMAPVGQPSLVCLPGTQ